MNRAKPLYALAFAPLLIGILSGCADFKPCGSQSCTSDEGITKDVETSLNKMAALGPPGSITVQTLDHVVYLNGTVDGGLDKRNAESVALQVPGVAQVVNSIAVSHN
jgi:osmotically-inducible protein OsmY